MLRLDSHGDISPIVNDLHTSFANLAVSPPHDERLSVQVDETPTKKTLTPLAFFSPRPGHRSIGFDMDMTPTPKTDEYPDLDGPTPKAS